MPAGMVSGDGSSKRRLGTMKRELASDSLAFELGVGS